MTPYIIYICISGIVHGGFTRLSEISSWESMKFLLELLLLRWPHKKKSAKQSIKAVRQFLWWSHHLKVRRQNQSVQHSSNNTFPVEDTNPRRNCFDFHGNVTENPAKPPPRDFRNIYRGTDTILVLTNIIFKNWNFSFLNL